MLLGYDKLTSISTAGFTETNAKEEPESYLSMSVWKCVYIYKFRIILVLTQLEATALRVNYSYNSISASLDVFFPEMF